MKRIFNFGKIAYYGNRKTNNVIVEIELKETKDGVKVFTASGEVWNASHTDIICGGQCLDTIKEYLNDNKLFLKIYEFWGKYHLNDMHAECEHQFNLGWLEQAKKEATTYTYSLTPEADSQQIALKNKILQLAKEGKTYKTNKEEQQLLNLKYFYKTHLETLPDGTDKFYKLYKTETKTLGWLKPSDHPDGILTKPCPICGYEYGTTWKTREIPQNDIEEIERLITEGE